MRLSVLLAFMMPWSAFAVTVTNSANCTSSSSTLSASCALGTVAAGDLLVAISKTGNTTGTASPAFSSTAGPTCTWHQAIAPTALGTGLHSNSTMFYCLLPTTGSETVQVAWSGPTGSQFTDLSASVWHTTGAWNTAPFDRSSVQLNTSATSTSCGSGSTAMATQNPNDFIIAACENFNQAETWGTYTGWTLDSAASRNTTGVYTKSITTTGIQSATVPLSTADYSVGMVAAFQASDVVDCSGGSCGLVQSTNSANQTTHYDHISLSNVVPGDTLIYMVYHSNWSGSGTTTMSDSSGKNTWYPCESATGGGASVSMPDINYASTFGMSCFYTIAVNGGGTITGLPVASDCSGASGCSYVGGWFAEFKGALKYVGWGNDVGLSSTASTKNVACGGLGDYSTQFPIGICNLGSSSGTATAGTGWSLFNTTNGNAQYIVDSAGTPFDLTLTLSAANVPYGAMSVFFK